MNSVEKATSEVLANGLFNQSGIVKVVAANTGEWFDINMKKVYELDYNELRHFQKVFTMGFPGDNQVMITQSMGMALITRFRRLLENQELVSKYEVLKDKNAVGIINIILKDNLIYPNGSMFDKKESKNLFFPVIVSSIMRTVVNSGELSKDSVFYKLDDKIQYYLIKQALTEMGHMLIQNKKDAESMFSRIIDAVGMNKIIFLFKKHIGESENSQKEYIHTLKDIFRNIKDRNSYSSETGKNEILFVKDDFDILSSELLSSWVKESLDKSILKEAFTNRDFLLIESLLAGKTKEEVSVIVSSEMFEAFFSGITMVNRERILNIYEKYSLADIWARDGVNIKSLYSQSKIEVVEHIMKKYPVDIEQFDKLYKFMEKRGMKEPSKQRDFEHFLKFANPIRLAQEFEEVMPVQQSAVRPKKF